MARPKPLETQCTVSIKADQGLRDAFILACQLQHTTASDVLRATMREYVAAHPVPANLVRGDEEDT